MKKNIIRIIILILVLTTLLIAFFSYYDYRPKAIQRLNVDSNSSINNAIDTDIIKIMTWNIGFGVLGEEIDYFTAGGTVSVAQSSDYVKKNLEGVIKILNSKPVDFYFLQEVDIHSKRSLYINQMDFIKSVFKSSDMVFAPNYVVKFVPYPPFNELGDVYSGLITFSKYKIDVAMRYSLPGNYKWPMKTVMPDRCILVTESKLSGLKGKLVMINIHNSAFDRNAKNRKNQIKYIKDFMIEQYRQGNYVVVGGDWNLIFSKNNSTNNTNTNDLMPYNWNPQGWKWAIDYDVPTNRKLTKPYKEGDTKVKLIDGFIVSPNIEIVQVKGIRQNFKYSDHNPVYLEIKVKRPN